MSSQKRVSTILSIRRPPAGFETDKGLVEGWDTFSWEASESFEATRVDIEDLLAGAVESLRLTEESCCIKKLRTVVRHIGV